MSYLKLADYLTDVVESKDPEMVSAALNAIRGDLDSHRMLIMGMAYAVFHACQLGDKDAVEPLLKGLGVAQRYPSAIAIAERAMNEDNGGVLYQVKGVTGPVESAIEIARILCRSLVIAYEASAQFRILRVLDSVLKQEEALIAHMESEVLV